MQLYENIFNDIQKADLKQPTFSGKKSSWVIDKLIDKLFWFSLTLSGPWLSQWMKFL
jgi:hypothetical protein